MYKRKYGARRPVIMLYGATGTRDSWFGWDQVLEPDGEISSITRKGWPVGSIDTLDYWGNDTLLTNLSDHKAEGKSMGIFAGGRAHLIGTSAGGLTILNWARAHPKLVKSLTLLIPVLDVQDVYDNNRNGFASVISSAYGGRPPDDHNPMDSLEHFQDFPISLYFSTNDTVTPIDVTLDWIDGLVNNDRLELHNMGAQGHFWHPDYWNPTNIISFLKRND